MCSPVSNGKRQSTTCIACFSGLAHASHLCQALCTLPVRAYLPPTWHALSLPAATLVTTVAVGPTRSTQTAVSPVECSIKTAVSRVTCNTQTAISGVTCNTHTEQSAGKCIMTDYRCTMMDYRCTMMDYRCTMMDYRCTMMDGVLTV